MTSIKTTQTLDKKTFQEFKTSTSLQGIALSQGFNDAMKLYIKKYRSK